MSPDLANSALAGRAPELVVLTLLASLLLYGFWRIWGKVQEGQEKLLAQVTAGADTRDDKFTGSLREQQAHFIGALERLETRRETAEEKLGAAVERAADKTSAVIAENTRALVENQALMLRVVQLLDRVEGRLEDQSR